MTPDERRKRRRDAIRIKRANIKRICPDCGVRELDKHFRYCAECAENRKYFTQVIGLSKWKSRDPEYMKNYMKEYRQKNPDYVERARETTREWRRKEESKKFRRVK